MCRVSMKSLTMHTNEATIKRSDATEVQVALFGCREKRIEERRTVEVTVKWTGCDCSRRPSGIGQ